LKNLILSLFLVSLYGCNGQGSTPISVSGLILSDSNASGSIPASKMSYYKAAVRHFADSLFTHRPFNGSLLVAKNGQIIYELYSGFRDPRTKTDSILPNTAFHLASVSKTFTAMAVLKLQEEGKLRTSDSVAAYLPGFPYPAITVKTLLNHRSGLPNYVHYMENLGWDRRKTISNRDVLDFIIARHQDIQTGSSDRRFSYSNTNFALLALIVEKVTGQSFPEYMKMAFFDPLGMVDTYVYTPADSAKSLKSYFYSGRPYAFDYLDNVYGDKNVYSTVRDMLKWDQALAGGALLSKASLDSAYAGYSFEKPGINNYGLGWRMFMLKNGKKFIYHNGWWHGNRTAFYRLLDENATIIAFSNNDFTKVYSAKKIADIFGNYFKNPEEEKASETVNTVKKASSGE